MYIILYYSSNTWKGCTGDKAKSGLWDGEAMPTEPWRWFWQQPSPTTAAICSV